MKIEKHLEKSTTCRRKLRAAFTLNICQAPPTFLRELAEGFFGTFSEFVCLFSHFWDFADPLLSQGTLPNPASHFPPFESSFRPKISVAKISVKNKHVRENHKPTIFPKIFDFAS